MFANLLKAQLQSPRRSAPVRHTRHRILWSKCDIQHCSNSLWRERGPRERLLSLRGWRRLIAPAGDVAGHHDFGFGRAGNVRETRAARFSSSSSPASTNPVKKVAAIIQPTRMDAVLERLSMIGARNVYVSDVQGFGRTRGQRLIHKGSPYEVAFVPKLCVEWYGDDHDADAVLRAIEHAARSGQLGDGRIFVSEIDGELEF
jgi:nitrogen regulatory protein P-II 1